MALPSGLPIEIGINESLARFVTSKGQFKGDLAKGTAFLPRPDSTRGDILNTSVFRREAISAALAPLGRQIMPNVNKIFGAVIVTAGGVRAAGLDVLAAEPPDHHANIEGWSNENNAESRIARNMELAESIASRANFLPF